MNAIEFLLQQPAAQAIGWALVQFIWQGALVGLLSAVALYALRRSAADVRYVVASIGLSLMLTMPAVTALQTWRSIADTGVPARGSSVLVTPTVSRGAAVSLARPNSAELAAAGGQIPQTSPQSERRSPMSRVTSIRVALLVWLSGVAFLTLRLLAGWLVVRRLRARGTAPAPLAWQQTAARLSKRLHIARPIRLLESATVEVPTVIGWLRPVVLMPASALAGMSPLQLEAILAHELAHIRRHDYLVNLLQTLVETLLFYHPAVWWLSGRIRVERENCCDDLAVSLCGDPYTYAKALADLEELRADSSRLVLAATGGSLIHRVRRLIGAPSHAGRGPGWLAASTAVVLIAGIAAGAVGTNALGPEQTDAAPAVVPTPSMTETPAPVLAFPSRGVGETRPVVAAAAPRRASATAPAVAPVVPAASVHAVESAAPVVASASVGESVASFVAEVLEQFSWSSQPVPPVPPTPPTPPVPPVPPTPPASHAGFAPPPTPPTPPTPAVPPTPPTPPVPPVPPSFAGIEQGRGSFSWSDGKQKLEVKYEGKIEFTDDDSDVKTLSPGGVLRIREGGWISSRTIEFEADASGTIRRRYWEGMSEKPFVPDGKAWLAQALPRIIRQTAFGAEGRVARILKAKGPAGVFAEITLIDGSWAPQRAAPSSRPWPPSRATTSPAAW